MARTLGTVVKVNRVALTANVAPATFDSANGMQFPNDGATWLELSSNDAVAHTVTVTLVSGIDGLTSISRTVTLPASTTAISKWGSWPVQYYGNILLVDANSAQVRIAAYTDIGP